MPQHDDHEFLQRICRREEAALRIFYRDFRTPAINKVKRLGGNENDGRDVFQDAILALFLSVCPKEDFVLPCPLLPYFLGIVRNIFLRKNNRDLDISFPEDPAYKNIEQRIIEAEENHRRFLLLEKTFGQLSELCQQLLEMVREGKTNNEIFDALSFTTMNNYYQRKYGCIKRWRELINQNQ